MDYDYWHKQTAEKPLFPDLIWNRPENRRHAGKLLIISGNSSGFAVAAAAFTAAGKAGIGSAHVLLPDSLARMVSRLFPEALFAPSTPSGSFARQALVEFLHAAEWSDGVLLPGDLSKNSETEIAFESFLDKFNGQATLADDAVDYALNLPSVLTRQNTVWVCDLARAQRLVVATKLPTALTSKLGLVDIVRLLHGLTTTLPGTVILTHEGTTYVAVAGSVSTTLSSKTTTEIAASAATWLIQNPTKPFEALTTAVL